MATLNRADIYGGPSLAIPQFDRVGVSGPNQSSVSNPSEVENTDTSTSPAFSWIGFILLLVALRVAIELASE